MWNFSHGSACQWSAGDTAGSLACSARQDLSASRASSASRPATLEPDIDLRKRSSSDLVEVSECTIVDWTTR